MTILDDIASSRSLVPGMTGVADASAALARAELKRRQDALLDDALLETFPASDPISVMRIT